MTDTNDSGTQGQKGAAQDASSGFGGNGAQAYNGQVNAGAPVGGAQQQAGTQPASAYQQAAGGYQTYGAQQPYNPAYQQAYQPPFQGYQAPPAPAAAGAYGAAPAKKSKAGMIALIIVLAIIALLLAIGTYTCSSAVNSLGSFSSDSFSSTSGPITSGPTVAVIDIDGTIQYDGTNNSPEGLRDEIKQAENDENIKAIVLRVNSGGGTSTAGEEMSNYIRDCSKPVVVSVGSMDASAAYMISSQADYIYANNTSAVGAIGTIMTTTDISELLEKLGINIDYIKSADSKDSTYGTRPLTDEEKAYYQDLVDQINSYFVQTVADGRGMSVDEVQKLATGLEFTGTDGVKNGLIDEIGTYDDALAKAAELGGISGSDYDVVNLSTSSDFSSLLSLLGSSEAANNDAVASDLQKLAQDLQASQQSSEY